ncbi:hypothetical protein G6F40_015477 [Rhizopus arrhizus]|nr:hypothetical protein G6F40_015477 [Rhizopus arrhizus]
MADLDAVGDAVADRHIHLAVGIAPDRVQVVADRFAVGALVVVGHARVEARILVVGGEVPGLLRQPRHRGADAQAGFAGQRAVQHGVVGIDAKPVQPRREHVQRQLCHQFNAIDLVGTLGIHRLVDVEIVDAIEAAVGVLAANSAPLSRYFSRPISHCLA